MSSSSYVKLHVNLVEAVNFLHSFERHDNHMTLTSAHNIYALKCPPSQKNEEGKEEKSMLVKTVRCELEVHV